MKRNLKIQSKFKRERKKSQREKEKTSHSSDINEKLEYSIILLFISAAEQDGTGLGWKKPSTHINIEELVLA